MKILVTRPMEDAPALAEALEARGIEAVVEPLMAIKFHDGPEIDLTDVQALLVTSANGVRALARATGVRDLPVYAVGHATAEAARLESFTVVYSAGGDVDDLAQMVTQQLQPAGGTLVHAAGSALAGDLSGRLTGAGFDCRREVLYESEQARALSAAAIAAIKDGDVQGVALFSPRTAAIFADLTRKARLVRSCRDLTAYCLSENVAREAADLPWNAVRIAVEPDQDSLIALIADDANGPAAVPEPEPELGPDADEKDDDMTAAPPPKASPIPASQPAAASELKPDQPRAASPPPSSSVQAPPARRGGGFAAVLVTVLVIALAAGGLAATRSMWVPAIAPYLPGEQVAEEPDPRFDMLVGRIDDLEKRSAAQAEEDARMSREEGKALADLEEKRAALANRIDETMTRVAQLEDAIGEVRELVEKTVALPAPEQPTEEIKSLTERIARMESSGSGVTEEDRALLDQLHDKVTRLEAQTTAAKSDSEGLRARALELAVGQLRAALHTPKPYAEALLAVKAIAADDPETADAVSALDESAHAGVPTLPQLRDRFGTQVEDILNPALKPEGDGWGARLLGKLASIVRIRRVPEGAEAEGPAGAVARAEAYLDAGNLDGAVDEIASVPGAAGDVAAWLADAKRRVAAERALAKLQVYAVSKVRSADG